MTATTTLAAGPKLVLCGSTDVTYSRRMGEIIEDTALMLRYRDGNAAAFETLYRRHNDSLYRFLLRMSMNHDTAEDIYQEVWRKIIESRERYRPTAKFTTFLYRIAHNCFIDHTRRNKRYSTRDFVDIAEKPDEADGPEVTTEKILFRRRLNVAIANLPDEQRHAFLLHEEAGLGLDGIAHISGTTRETVKSRLRYANNKLKKALLPAKGKPDDQL